jgi:hypothetical protein
MLLPAAAALLGLGGACGTGPDSNSPGWQELQNLSAFEREVLGDKYVDLAELERANQLYSACLTAADVSAVRPDLRRPGPNGVVKEYTAATQDEANRKEARIAECYARVSAVQEVWILQSQASEEERQLAKAAFVDCARGAGLDVSAGASFDDTALAAHQFVEAAKMRASPDATGPDPNAVGACLKTIALALESAMPGLEEALDDLDV